MMSAPIWQKNTNAEISQPVMDYMAGEDLQLDQSLLSFDIQASIAHVEGLGSIDVLDSGEVSALVACLNQLLNAFENAEFTLDPAFEDGHSAIEAYLVEELGELGKKVHTGRSRNDQVLVATRLYLKQCLETAMVAVERSIEICLEKADSHQTMVMPGYTHIQRAVPSSAGMWFAGFAEAFIDNLQYLKQTLSLIDSNPLGTAAGYGVNLPLNRQLTTELLGFSRMQINPVYTQNSRGKLEIAVLNAFSACLLDVRRLSWDLSLFSSQEFGFVTLPDVMTTGSSIMPNKRNPDLIELMRASYPCVQAAIVELQSLLSLPSGYQRDLQFGKAPLLRASEKTLTTLALLPDVIDGIAFNAEAMRNAIDAPMHATDIAVDLTSKGVAFRDAYREVGSQINELKNRDASESIEQRVSPGACANLMLELLHERLAKIRAL